MSDNLTKFSKFLPPCQLSDKWCLTSGIQLDILDLISIPQRDSVCPYNNVNMRTFDLCLAWNWEYDADFVSLMEEACSKHGSTFLQVKPGNLEVIKEALASGEISFRAFFDRASDSDPDFLFLEEWSLQHHVFQVNPRHQISWIHDKTAVHLAFYESGLLTPYTFLLPSFSSQPELPALDLNQLGSQFAIKPATGGGGGEGVVLNATLIEQVNAERRRNPNEKYLLQAQLEPSFLHDHQAWFRVLVCNGNVFPCWWDPNTHRYTPVTKEEMINLDLFSLWELAKRIASISKMDLFSSEIALTKAGQFLVVDYVNDPIDMRLQSSAFDGVPDDIVKRIAFELADFFQKNLAP